MSAVLDDAWTRDVAVLIGGWLVVTVIAIVLLLTVVRGLFL